MAKKLWGGRFKKETDKRFEAFSKSIHYDCKLVEYDLFHSFIHIRALHKTGLLTKNEVNKLSYALWEIKMEVGKGKFTPDLSCEDIHTDVQNRIEKKAGSLLASKLHTLRSRNDQIVFDEKWYCHSEALCVMKLISGVMSGLQSLSEKYKDYCIPGYTHARRAQVVRFSDYLGAFGRMFGRDYDRLDNFLKNLSIYIGSAAIAGSAISKEAYDHALKEFLDELKYKFKHGRLAIVENPIDNVSDRDFIIEFLSALSILQVHLSRLAEDFILYSTNEFNFLDLPEEFCTGSSLMPHKKNPDFLELTRGSSGKVFGNLMSILTIMKGLPLAYNRDMQLDKEPLFSSLETIKEELSILSRFLPEVGLNSGNIMEALRDDNLYATEIAEFLVLGGVAFGEAHKIVGRLIRYAEDNKIKIKNISEGVLKKFHPRLNSKIIKKIADPYYAVSSKKSIMRMRPF